MGIVRSWRWGTVVDFEWSAEEARFRTAVEEVVRRHLDPDWPRSPASLGSSQWTPMTAEFCRRLAEHHLLVPSWPVEYGGNDAPVWQQQILAEVMWEHGEPRGPQYMNVNWIGPAIIGFGSDELKERFLPPMARGEIVWCQGFSEPDAGSDLASLRTAARLDGDCYVVNGQKIWTSYADTAQHCFLLVRTGTVESRHRGLTVLLVEMTTPGLEVRKIDSIAGEHAFHEVFLNDVLVPASQRLGDENKGWAVVRHALAYERIGLPRYVRASGVLDLVAARAGASGRLEDPAVLARMAEARACCEAARLLVYRAVDERAKGEGPSASAYLARAAVVDAARAVAAAANDALGAGAGAPGDLADVQLRNALAVGLAGGAYEIQLGLVAEQLLGLARS
jgi:alkylation response protein AidB-like acyl-CoA dehydrogenase